MLKRNAKCEIVSRNPRSAARRLSDRDGHGRRASPAFFIASVIPSRCHDSLDAGPPACDNNVHGIVCRQSRRLRASACSQRLFAEYGMSRAASAFKQSDVTRAARAVVNAGLKVSGIKIAPSGEIRIDVLTSDSPTQTVVDSFEEWKSKRNARRPEGHRHVP
jgi:hypothetical protein